MEEANVVASNTTSESFSDAKKKIWNIWMNLTPNLSFLSSSFGIRTSFFLLLLVVTYNILASRWTLISIAGSYMQFAIPMIYDKYSVNYTIREEFILNCTSSSMTITCPANYPPQFKPSLNFPSNRTCPEYFRWIHEDLKTWKEKGITQQMVEGLKEDSHFRLVVVNGTAYVKQYVKAQQSRDTFTFWGILQLLTLYPGRLPDLDLMFQCDDFPLIKREKYLGENSTFAPPLFHYCGDDSTFDIVFPDWSFWGWMRVNLKPWTQLAKDLKEGNSMKNWTRRKPFAFWKGNVQNGITRNTLVDCASTEDWNAEIVHQSWDRERRTGFGKSDLKKQCVHRYKIYVEGFTWSISKKYILACDSMTLVVNPVYYDFFTRSLIPLKHYWPINTKNLCKSIKFAVDWGNNNPDKAQEIGKAGSGYIFEQVKMEHVYDYMFHVLNEYAKMLKHKPTVPEGAVELCSDKISCSPTGPEMSYKIATTVNGPAKEGPCDLPPPYDPNTLRTLRDQKAKIKEAVEMWENASG